MKTLSLARITSLAFLTALSGSAALEAGCAASVEDAGSAADAPEAIAQTSQAVGTTPRCKGKAPPAKACNTVVCDGVDYNYVPSLDGTACTTAAGAQGTCATDWQAGQCFQKITGTLIPKYYVVTVQYAPPGSASSVDYGTSSTSTTTTTTSDSFDKTISLSANVPFTGSPLSADINVSYSETASSTHLGSVEVKATATTDLTINGYGDAVDHGLDRIYLRLKPTLNVTSFGKDVSWSFAPSSAAPFYVTPAWLLGRSPMPAKVQSALQAAGITSADYPAILGVDPYAVSAPLFVDGSRYVLQTKLNYEPVTEAGSTPTPEIYSTAAQTTITGSTEAKTTSKVDVTESASLLNVLTLTNENTMTWTYDNVASSATASQISAKATIMQPAVGYAGGLSVDVYLDTIFNTFLFVIPSDPLIYHGPPGGTPVNGKN